MFTATAGDDTAGLVLTKVPWTGADGTMRTDATAGGCINTRGRRH